MTKKVNENSRWQPITETALWELMNDSEPKLSAQESHFFETIRILPEKWKLDPWGLRGSGFWVVGLIGKRVLLVQRY